MADLETLTRNPRTPDNFEVFRRWEEVRAKKWLTSEQKQLLRNAQQEYTLLLNEKNELELVPYDKIMNVANESRDVIAFTFERGKNLYAVYWHISGDKKLELPLKSENITLMESLGQEIPPLSGHNSDRTLLPVGKRRYIKTSNISRDELITAFKNAKIID
jgi:hypothetical protein